MLISQSDMPNGLTNRFSSSTWTFLVFGIANSGETFDDDFHLWRGDRLDELPYLEGGPSLEYRNSVSQGRLEFPYSAECPRRITTSEDISDGDANMLLRATIEPRHEESRTLCVPIPVPFFLGRNRDEAHL